MKRPLTRAAFERLVRRYPGGSRNSSIRVHGGRASENGTMFSRDEIEFEDETGIQKLQFFESSSCDNGHVLGTANAEIVGTCKACKRWLCTAPGCAFTCADHGYVVCGRHAFQVDGRVLCSQHRILYVAKTAALVGVSITGALARPVLGVIGDFLRSYTGLGRKP